MFWFVGTAAGQGAAFTTMCIHSQHKACWHGPCTNRTSGGARVELVVESAVSVSVSFVVVVVVVEVVAKQTGHESVVVSSFIVI